MDSEKKKKKKKDPYKQKKFRKALTKAILIEIAIILFFSCAIYEQRTPTEENTYQITGKVEDYHIDHLSRHNWNYYFWIDGVKYKLDRFFHTSREDSSQTRIDQIMAEDEITLTVMDSFRIGKWIVDIRSQNTVYHDIEDAQDYRSSQRTLAIVSFIMILVVYNVFASVPVLHWYEFPKRKYKKKK